LDGDAVLLASGWGQPFFGSSKFSVFYRAEVGTRHASGGGEDDDEPDDFTDYERFRIWSDECSDCEVPEGHVFFQSVATGKWWVAHNCGGGALLGNAETLVSHCSRFEIIFQ
jgi:hypothetical protein